MENLVNVAIFSLAQQKYVIGRMCNHQLEIKSIYNVSDCDLATWFVKISNFKSSCLLWKRLVAVYHRLIHKELPQKKCVCHFSTVNSYYKNYAKCDICKLDQSVCSAKILALAHENQATFTRRSFLTNGWHAKLPLADTYRPRRSHMYQQVSTVVFFIIDDHFQI